MPFEPGRSGNPAGGPVGSRHRQQLNGEFIAALHQIAVLDLVLARDQQRQNLQVRCRLRPAHTLNRFRAATPSGTPKWRPTGSRTFAEATEACDWDQSPCPHAQAIDCGACAGAAQISERGGPIIHRLIQRLGEAAGLPAYIRSAVTRCGLCVKYDAITLRMPISRKGRSGCMERIAIAAQDGGAGAGARHEAAARAARLACAEGPGTGDFSVSNFHPGLIPGNLA